VQRVRSTQKLPMPLASRRGEAANQGKRQHDADRGRDKIMDREPRHLNEVAHRGLRYVGLPVRVGNEAHRGVERQHLLHPGLPLGVERQIPLQALQRVERREADDAEKQHRHSIAAPGQLLGLIDAATPIDEAFDRTQQRAQGCPLACEHAGHVAAERPRDRDDDQAKERDLQPSIAGHWTVINPLDSRGEQRWRYIQVIRPNNSNSHRQSAHDETMRMPGIRQMQPSACCSDKVPAAASVELQPNMRKIIRFHKTA